jgi:hypothetical protein
VSSPIQFRGDEDFTMTSNIELKCSHSHSTDIQWSIYNCTTICVNPIQIDPTIMTTFSELYIPAQTLPFGTYKLKLVVSMINASNVTSSVSAYVKVTRAGINANMVMLGTSMVSIGYQQDLQLNPGVYSIDLDGQEFNGNVTNSVVVTDRSLISMCLLGLAISILLSNLRSCVFS